MFSVGECIFLKKIKELNYFSYPDSLIIYKYIFVTNSQQKYGHYDDKKKKKKNR